jgi:hypothetical protein
MKYNIIKTGAMPVTARDLARISENDAVTLLSDFGKSWSENNWVALVAGAGKVERKR